MTFTTTLAALVGSAAIGLGSIPTPQWHSNYSQAYSLAAEQKKPLAVFIGTGKAGLEKLITEGGLSTSEGKLLAESYICLYVDSQTDSGKKLTKSFEITEGVVISDRTGGLQAVRHEGAVTQSELKSYLTTYADKERVVTTTQLGGRLRNYLNDPNRFHPVQNTIQTFTGYRSGSS